MPRRERTKIDYTAIVQNFCLMDDEFMTVFFDGQTECAEYVLRIILNRDDLHVIKSESQYSQTNLYGRSGRLDILAKDNTGKLYNIEIQRADKGAGAKRARFNLGLIDTRTLKKGQDTEELPEVYVIFITENDVLGEGKAVYRIDRYIDGKRLFGDDAHIIYVNGVYRGADAIGDLMHDFFCRKSGEMKADVLSSRAKYLKSKEQEVAKMSYVVEELVKQAEKSRDIDTAVKMLEQGRIREDELAEFFGFSPEHIEEVVGLAREGKLRG